MRFYTLLLAFLCCYTLSMAQDAYRIKIEIEGYQQDTLMLAYYLGDKQYLQDTTLRQLDGSYIFEGDEPLKGGIYLVVMKPDNSFFQVLVDDRNQVFGMKTVVGDDQVKRTSFTGSPDNKIFYDYLRYLNDQRPAAEAIQKRLEAAEKEKDKAAIQKELEDLNE
ncbi:MAG: DUF4369 domain-containing protein, partial [Saprospiraceae bacterium]